MSDQSFQQLIVEAMAKAACPICTVLDAMVFEELCQLQRQAVVDPETHADVLARGGYCAEHFWYLDALASPVTNATLLAPLLDQVSDQLGTIAREVSGSTGLLRQAANQIAERLGTPRACRVCDRLRLWEDAALQALLAIIRESERRETYVSSTGLCLPHLARALSVCADRAVAAALVRAAEEQARRLATQLRTYVRKWQTRDRSWGPEEAAERAAIEKLVGGRQGHR